MIAIVRGGSATGTVYQPASDLAGWPAAMAEPFEATLTTTPFCDTLEDHINRQHVLSDSGYRVLWINWSACRGHIMRGTSPQTNHVDSRQREIHQDLLACSAQCVRYVHAMNRKQLCSQKTISPDGYLPAWLH